ncbi:MAG: Eco57I restriction endonuclease [Anaerosolibacter sp.]|uniref:type IIL restriction-modification enzyme MmeI n=1 Tax=Anaerosolibacter sp. TaxID=1872527 RepID=UPI0026320133|nr:type IIL restriction-modification enzyme MmeI [Anaerosolibacter sp.]MDF2545341.1 Eco57I restriction endonuclease [Anaerosolibacter sp.]
MNYRLNKFQPLFSNKIVLNEIKGIKIPNFREKHDVIRRWIINKDILQKSNEEEIKPDYFIDFFKTILGYTGITTQEDKFTLRIEKKTETDRTKPDGILGFYDKKGKTETTQAVIEVKGWKIDLDAKQKDRTPVEQAFRYLHKYDKCRWVIVTNFYELRLYKNGRSQNYCERFFLEDL